MIFWLSILVFIIRDSPALCLTIPPLLLVWVRLWVPVIHMIELGLIAVAAIILAMALHPFEWLTLARLLMRREVLLALHALAVKDERLISAFPVPSLILVGVLKGFPALILIVIELITSASILRVALHPGDRPTITCFSVLVNVVLRAFNLASLDNLTYGGDKSHKGHLL